MARKTVAILQSNYLPWKGYFQIIDESDVFVFYDDVQYTKNDWRNRNLVKSANGPLWITVPVLRAGRAGQRILDAQINPAVPWARSHRRTIEQNYARAPHLDAALEMLDVLYAPHWERLSELNQFSIRRICEAIGIRTEFQTSTEFPDCGDPTGRLVEICRRLDATEYLTGPTAVNYLDVRLFDAVGDRMPIHEVRPSGVPAAPPALRSPRLDHRPDRALRLDCRPWIGSLGAAAPAGEAR